MVRNLPQLPKCRKCGNNIIGNGSGDLCRSCMLREIQDSYQQANTAEHILNDDKRKYQRFSGFSSVVTFAIVLVVLILVVGALYYF